MKRGDRTHLVPASVKSVRRVERCGKAAGPVAGKRNVCPRDTKDLLLGVGLTRETNNPASFPLFIKKHPTQVQSIEDEKHEREDYKF